MYAKISKKMTMYFFIKLSAIRKLWFCFIFIHNLTIIPHKAKFYCKCPYHYWIIKPVSNNNFPSKRIKNSYILFYFSLIYLPLKIVTFFRVFCESLSMDTKINIYGHINLEKGICHIFYFTPSIIDCKYLIVTWKRDFSSFRLKKM